jgi:hypothetical protein
MTASVVYIEHCLVPQNRQIEDAYLCSITELDPAWARPYIALVDGAPVLRADWPMTIIDDGQILVFVDVEAIPQGGSGSNPMQALLMIGVAMLAMYTGGAAAGLFGTTAAGGITTTGAFAGALASSAVMMAGGMLVNMILPPSTLSPGGQALPTASPTYSIAAQGNSVRLEAAIPEHFGKMAFYPDLAALPYQEFHGNEQFVYILLCLGRGSFSIENIYIEDTPLSNFEEVNYEVIDPQGKTTLFPGNVVTSVEVVGQDLAEGVYAGPFTTNAPGTVCNTIGIDFVATQGLFSLDTKSGAMYPVSVPVKAEARKISNTGVPIGDWFLLGPLTWVPNEGAEYDSYYYRTTAESTGTWSDTHTYTGATATPQRFSEKYIVDPGRYEVRVVRTSPNATATTIGDDMVWAGMRAYLEDDLTYGDVTLLGVRMRATSQLSGLSSR